MDQLTWLQQSLQKPRLSALARELAGIFPRPGVPQVQIGAPDAPRGSYNSAAHKPGSHAEYPGHILRYREFQSNADSVEYGWARPYTDHIGILGGQVTVANDGFFTGLSGGASTWISTLYYAAPEVSRNASISWTHSSFTGTLATGNFASLSPILSGLKTAADGGPLRDADGTILLSSPLAWEPPEARGFTSIQWLTGSETRRD